MVQPPRNTSQKQPRKAAADPKICEFKADEDKRTVLQNAVGGGNLAEGIPRFNELPCETVVSGKNNTWIVLGRDRPAGGMLQAETQAGAIDIVVGRMGHAVRECGKNGEDLWTDPIFSGDAARIYICQKTAIDANFRLAAGKIGSPGFEGDGKKVQEPSAESGIAVKADQVRIIARRGIKLVTMGKQEPTSHTDKPPRSLQGIDIIAGNITTGKIHSIQPMVKGDNLKFALTKLTEIIMQFIGVFHASTIYQDQVNADLADHFHIWGPKQKTSKAEPLSTTCKNTLDSHTTTTLQNCEDLDSKLSAFTVNCLLESGDKYINSRWNNVN